MTAIEYLSSDVLFEVLTALDNLQQLYTAIITCRAFNEAFQNRRSLILQHIWSKELRAVHVAKWKAKHKSGTGRGKKQWSLSDAHAELDLVQSVVERCKTTSEDALLLHAISWNVFLSFKHNLWVDSGWTKVLIDRYVAANKQKDALACASQMWQCTIENANVQADQYRGSSSTCWRRYRMPTPDLAEKLAKMLADDEQFEAAVSVIQQLFEKASGRVGLGVLQKLLRHWPHDIAQASDNLVVFLKERTAKMWESVLTVDRLGRPRTSSPDYGWTYSLVTALNYLDRQQEAIEVMGGTFRHALTIEPHESIIIGVARRYIRMLKGVNRYNDLLAVRKEVYSRLVSEYATSPTRYLAWAKEYTSDLRLAGREVEAISVEEQLWSNMSQLLRNSNAGDTLYHARNAGWALASSYRERGDLKKAQEVQTSYEEVANRLSDSKVRLAWSRSTDNTVHPIIV